MNRNGSQILDQSVVAEKFSRRQAARLLLSAAVALPAFSADHPLWHHIANSAFPESADAQLASANWKPLFLSPSQEESVRSLAEVMLPGSAKALVSRFIDLLLCVDTEVHQKKFLASLAAIDEESAAKFAKPFAKLAAQDQTSLLSSMSSRPSSGDPGSPMRSHFGELKEWIVGAFYSSEIGLRELGWTPDRVFANFPSCTHTQGHS